MADRQELTRAVANVVLECTPHFKTAEEVVFAEPGGMGSLGARTLERFHSTVDQSNERFSAAGPGLTAGNY